MPTTRPLPIALILAFMVFSACGDGELEQNVDTNTPDMGLDQNDSADDGTPSPDVSVPDLDIDEPDLDADTGDEPDVPSDESGWATQDLVALYTFEEAAGTTVADVSGVNPPLNLTVGTASAAFWSPAGLSLNSQNLVSSSTSAQRLTDAVTNRNELSVDVWITPAFPNQMGPARIVTSSTSTSARNFTLGQHGNLINARIRTTETDVNGNPAVESPALLGTEAIHIVYTRSAAGNAVIYIDGQPVSQETVGGNLSNWDTGYSLALGSEFSGDGRPWLGTYHRVAIYSRALTQAEVTSHFALGQEKLNFEVPEDAFPVDPFGPTAGLGERGAGGGFLWKPVSESNGNLVVLLPSQYTGIATGAHVATPTGALIEAGRYAGVHNGNRQHYRFNQGGAAYGNDIFVVAYTPTGNIHWPISNGANRITF